jgi:hypothetical protein
MGPFGLVEVHQQAWPSSARTALIAQALIEQALVELALTEQASV